MLNRLNPIVVLSVFLLLVAATVMGCSRTETTQVSTEKGATATQAMITIKGSDTMVHLVSTWAEKFMKKNPEFQVSVTGGGSGTGIAALLNSTTDIAASSRDIKEKELKQAEANGVMLEETVVGKDAIAIVVNPENPVKTLTMGQLKDIYTGKTTNWKQVGGADQAILAYSRESSSGTYAFFQEHVLEKQDYAKSARLMPATSAIIEAVSSDKGGIGYVGLGYTTGAQAKVNVLDVKSTPEAKAVSPSEETVGDKSYPIARELYLYAPQKSSGAVQAFIQYTLSPEGQKVVQETGYIPQKSKANAL